MTRLCLTLLLLLVLGVRPARAEAPAADAQQAARLSTDGLAASLRGEFATASRLYRHAYALDPSPEYLYSAARSEHQAGQCEVAVADYATLLQLPSVSQGLRIKGEFHLADAQTALAEHRCVAVQARPPSHARAYTGFALIGAGGAVIVGAAALWLHARTDQTALDGYRDPAGRFRPDLIGPTAAIDAQSSINERTVAAWSLLGVGAVAAGVATWLLIADAPAVAQVGFDLQGVRVAGRF